MSAYGILSASGVCGSGFREASSRNGLDRQGSIRVLRGMPPRSSSAELLRLSNASPLIACSQPVVTIILNARQIATLYGLAAAEVKFFECEAALAFKASIPRPCVQGDPGDSDGHGGQQYAPLVDLEMP
jgi:hypothetical protein